MHHRNTTAKTVLAALLTLAWLALFAFQLIIHNGVTFSQVNNDPKVVPDFHNFYSSVQIFLDTGNLYPLRIPYPWSINGSQPAGSLPFLLLTQLPFDVALFVWYGLSLVLLAVACWWVWKVYPSPKKHIPWLIMLVIISSPFFEVIKLANWGLVLTFGVIAAWYFLRQGRDITGGVFLGLSLLVRFHPIFVLFYLIITRRWKVVFATLGTLAVGNLIALPVFGLENYFRYVRQALDMGVSTANNRWEHSILGLFQNTISLLPDAAQPTAQTFGRIGFYVIGLLVVGLLLFLSRKVSFDSAFGLMIVAGLLVVVPSGTYYELLLLPALAMLWPSHPWVVVAAVVRIVAHNSTFLFSFGDYTNLVWTSTFIAVLAAMAVSLYQAGLAKKPTADPTSVQVVTLDEPVVSQA